MSSVLQRLLHNLNLHSLLPSHWDSMAVVVGLGWCMTVLSPDVTFHIQQRMGYNCNPTHFVNFNIRTVYESIGWYLNWFVFDKISVSGNLVCFCKFTWRILHHRCTILSILIKSPRSGLYVFSLFPPRPRPPLQKLFPLTSKPFELNLWYLAQRIYGSGELYWMTFPWPWPKVMAVASISQNVLVCTIKWEPLIGWLQNVAALLP